MLIMLCLETMQDRRCYYRPLIGSDVCVAQCSVLHSPSAIAELLA